jgi:hypothetical protein
MFDQLFAIEDADPEIDEVIEDTDDLMAEVLDQNS